MMGEEDRSLGQVLGRLEAGFEAVIERVNRSDEQTAQKFSEMNGLHERDRAAAIKAREDKEARENIKHEQNQAAIETVRTEVKTVANIARQNADWIAHHGKPMADAWFADQQRKLAKENERRGSAKTWAAIGAIGTAAGTAIGTALTYGREILELISRKP